MNPVRTYSDGQPWKPAHGRHIERSEIEDHLSEEHAVVCLRENPPRHQFLHAVLREMRIRFYRPRSISNYQSALRGFLNWYSGSLNDVSKEDVREYLDLLVTGGASASQVSVTLSAIRTAFDKFCQRRCTVGLVTPRKQKRLPVVLSKQEVQDLISACRSFRDKLLISVLYATGLRVSEVSRLRWVDLDFDRNQIRIEDGKGAKDRVVMLASQLRPLLREVWKVSKGQGYLFPSETLTRTSSSPSSRHLSPRTIQRVVSRAVQIAGLNKKATPHSFRHSFATHLVESGTDIRFIQKLLGHANLDTTTIYARVATSVTSTVTSPLESLAQSHRNLPTTDSEAGERRQHKPSVGRLRLMVEQDIGADGFRNVKFGVHSSSGVIEFPGVRVSEPRPGWMNLEIPAIERWQRSLSQLTPEQRQRFDDPEFYELLRYHIAVRRDRVRANVQSASSLPPEDESG